VKKARRRRAPGQNRGVRKRWLVLGLVVVAGGAGTAVYLTRDHRTTKTAAADVGAVTVSVASTGTVEASSIRSLSFTVDGTVTAVKVRAGAKVAKARRWRRWRRWTTTPRRPPSTPRTVWTPPRTS
jgi:multidrug efflux pump subunit AcrA (membrane-fusion protein)